MGENCLQKTSSVKRATVDNGNSVGNSGIMRGPSEGTDERHFPLIELSIWCDMITCVDER